MSSPRIRLIFAIHNHQPVGNFDGVFEQAYRDAYEPFFDVLDEFPEIPITAHFSGSLLEWLEVHRPHYVDRIRVLVAQGRLEILGGPYFEPILASIPRRDRIGQIRAYTQHLANLFETNIRGMWVPERVWEPTFASDIVEAGIEYTILDDSHFRWAGLSEDKLHGYYITENEGRILKVFPDDEPLRYAIPWAKPLEAIAYLKKIGDRHPGTIVSFGDDGEKFGSWPGTQEHVYEKGWLRDFFTALKENSSWLRVVTMAQAVDQVPPQGKIYLPNASYREMTEWALPTDQQLNYQRVNSELSENPDWPDIKPFIRAGFWRNFLVKYPESNEMYCRSREVSERVNALTDSTAARENADLLHSARMDLYRGQCNCPFWHGAFGGLYLPHLRNAIYHHLIAADNAVEQLHRRPARWVDIAADDYNLDARKEVRMSGDRMIAYLAPARGGHLYELDLRSTKVNLLATLNRRPEPYHQTVLESAAAAADVDDIAFLKHEGVRFKQSNLDQKIAYDRWPRKSLVDHFLRPDVDLEEFQTGNGGIGDFVLGVYETRLRRSDERVETVMTREGRVGEHWVRVEKTVSLESSNGSQLEITYELSQLPAGVPIHFAVEFNFAAMPAGLSDRYYYNSHGEQLGQLETVQSLPAGMRIGLVDEWLGIDASLELTQPAEFWTFPIETVSQSEGGFELVHQSSTVVPHWKFTADHAGRWQVRIQLTADTSIAQARKLAELASLKH
ncbi:alpha-amylase/4-alpha-glucanotransferase domain-containing protein [Planctomicrobium sp. SH668]|uniref:alpha-amylase/4-alpha-glucanotransferase domain-containing protein n=1 Tax=Planctomicrobium sp. SH668 TaxID=3448126 RepID=UPI003F5B7639